MTDAADKTQLVMTPKAAEAFADYVAMPPGERSLRGLCDRYRQRGASKSPTTRYETLFIWSTNYGWQDRIANAVTDLTRQRLEQAAELDADTYRTTSQLLNERVGYTTHHHLDAIIDIRAAVKPALPKTEIAGTVNVKHDHKHSGVVEHAHHDLSHLSDEQIERAIEARRMYDEAVAPGKPDGPER